MQRGPWIVLPRRQPALRHPHPPSAPTPGPVAKPSPAAAPQGATSGLADARSQLARGEFALSARGFGSTLRATAAKSFTVQLLVACSDETVQKAVASAGGSELFILPVNLKGRDCYRVCWGIYDSALRAESAGRGVPEHFRQGGSTARVVPTASLLP